MAEPKNAAPPPAPLPSRALGIEKAAVLLLTLGPDIAGQIFKHLDENEVKLLSAAIAQQRSIPKMKAARVHEEAWRKLSMKEAVYVDGAQFAQQLISTAAQAAASGSGGEKAAKLRELQRATAGSEKWLQTTLEPVAPSVIAQMLSSEHPQVLAFVLAYMQPRQAAEVLGQLAEELQADVVQRIADMQNVSDEMFAEIGEVLQAQMQGLGRSAQGGKAEKATGAKRAADIMNAVEKTVEGRVFASLENDFPEIAERIREQMFTFEDLLQLDNRGMQVVLKEVAREDLILALKTASPAMKDKIFTNISARAAEILKDDMSTMGPVKLRDVEKAQGNIIAVVRRLQAEQKIVLGGGTGDDVLV